MVDIKQTLKMVGATVFGFALLSLLLMWWANWIPFPNFLIHPKVVGAGVVVLIIAGIVYKFRGKTSQRDIQEYLRQNKQSQLTDEQAFEIVRFELWENRNIRIDEVVERGPEKVNPGDKQGDPVRLYKLIFERVMVSERVGVVMDLEQEIEVDVESWDSLKQAAEEVQNIKLIRGKKVDDLNDAVEDAVSSLGQSLDQKITEIEHKEDGSKIEKIKPAWTALNQGKRPDETGSKEVE